jgi:hypothetical protein
MLHDTNQQQKTTFKRKIVVVLITFIFLLLIAAGLMTAGISERLVLPSALALSFLISFYASWRLKYPRIK